MKAQLEQIRRAAKEALASFDSAEQLEKPVFSTWAKRAS